MKNFHYILKMKYNYYINNMNIFLVYIIELIRHWKSCRSLL